MSTTKTEIVAQAQTDAKATQDARTPAQVSSSEHAITIGPTFIPSVTLTPDSKIAYNTGADGELKIWHITQKSGVVDVTRDYFDANGRPVRPFVIESTEKLNSGSGTSSVHATQMPAGFDLKRTAKP